MQFSAILEKLKCAQTAARSEFDKAEGALDQLDSDISSGTTLSEQVFSRMEILAEAQDVLRVYARAQEDILKTKVEALVSNGLQAVLDRDDMEFSFRFGESHGQATVTPIIRSKYGDTVLETEAMDSRGGGVMDVASFVLRATMLILVQPPLKRILFLDEPFKMLSREHLPRASELVRKLSDRLGIQVVMVSHKDEMIDAADKVFDVRLVDGATQIEERV